MAKYLEVAGKADRGLNWDSVRDEPYPGVMVYDMRNLPMKGVVDNTYDGIYSEHFIEHLTKDEGINFFKSPKDKVFVKGLRNGRKLSAKIFTICMSIYASFNLGYFFWDINAQPTIFPASFFKEWNNPPNDFSLDLYAYFLAKKKGYEIKRFNVKFSERLFGISKWNFNFNSKVKFIKRNINYIIKLSKEYTKWK